MIKYESYSLRHTTHKILDTPDDHEEEQVFVIRNPVRPDNMDVFSPIRNCRLVNVYDLCP